MLSENRGWQGQLTESEQSVESRPEEDVRGNTTAPSDPRWHRLAQGSWGVTARTGGLFSGAADGKEARVELCD